MLIALDGKILAVAVYLSSIGMISAEVRTLQDLFTEYSYGMPPVETVQFEHQFPNFETFAGNNLRSEKINLLKRARIIFGWQNSWDLILDPCELFRMQNVYIVFDTKREQWVFIPRELSRELGAGRFWKIVFARDEAVATQKLKSGNAAYKEAHMRAFKHANDRLDIVEQEQVSLLNIRRTTFKKISRVIIEEYCEAYNREFSRCLFQHGEYNLDGYRRKSVKKNQ